MQEELKHLRLQNKQQFRVIQSEIESLNKQINEINIQARMTTKLVSQSVNEYVLQQKEMEVL